jgi:hypothetical protein
MNASAAFFIIGGPGEEFDTSGLPMRGLRVC